MGTLMELSGDYRLLLDTMESAEPEEIQVFEDTLESVLAEVENKADAYAVVIREAKSTAEKYQKEADRLSEKAQVIENSIQRMKDRLKIAMETMKVTKLEGDYHKFRIQKNGGKVGIEYLGDVPDSYKKVVLEDDTARIREDLEAGKELGFARLKERGTHLRID